ncbi:alpha/beta fold hydrolase [Nocardiopsis ganjiahuensis]|uniref:alpha/beta fold hydrolase n=1 Tax=Nocardiopsis ganjiahuensis TaxID=239984 RepID=UPI00034CBC5F|nr:alpha/beta hydrolase [Nocardiopsis ganjiahuensis]
MPTFTAPDGTELAYRLEGRGEPLLCLPGGPMRASAYLGDLGGLSDRRRLVLLDLRGTGGSATPQDPTTYRCDRQVGDVEALRAHLGLERMDVLAHSAAGDLGLSYALAHPEHVRTLTLVTARARALGVDFTREHREEAAALRVKEPWYEEAIRSYRNLLTGSESEEDWNAVLPFFYGNWDAAAQEHAASATGQSNEEAAALFAPWEAFSPDGARAVVASWDVRVLILAGELDSAPLPRVGAQIAELFAEAEVAVLPGGGHFPWLDDPDFFSRTVGDFLDR